MREALARVLPVWLAVLALGGCVHTQNLAPDPVEPSADKGVATTTQLYWQQLNEVMRVRAKSDGLADLSAAVRQQAEALRNLSVLGVDAELVAATEVLAKAQDRMVEVAQIAGNDPANLKKSAELNRAFRDAGRQTAEAMNRLRAMRGKLAARYSADFPQLEG